MNRRDFIKNTALSLCALSLPVAGRKVFGANSDPIVLEKKSIAGIPEFIIPSTTIQVPKTGHFKRVVFVRYGGGVRREETISKKTESPFFYHGLLKEGTLFSDVWIDRKSVTGHAQGSLYSMTGRFDDYEGEPFDTEYIPRYPTLAEYVRKAFKKRRNRLHHDQQLRQHVNRILRFFRTHRLWIAIRPHPTLRMDHFGKTHGTQITEGNW